MASQDSITIQSSALDEDFLDHGISVSAILGTYNSAMSAAPPIISGSGVLAGDIYPVSITIIHDFKETLQFPDLKERIDVSTETGGANFISVIPDGLTALVETTVTINMVSSGAGYNNTLGAYTIGADGTIQAVELAYTNVKTPLSAKSAELKALGKEESALAKTIVTSEKSITDTENKIVKDTDSLNKWIEKIAQIEAKTTLTKGDQAKIDSYQKQIDKLNNALEAHAQKIAGLSEKIDVSQARLDEIIAEKAALANAYSYEYSLDAQYGDTLGLFIISDGDRKNAGYSNIDLENGELRFVFNLGQDTERLATIHDSAANITLVHSLNGVDTILKGDVYHSLERGASALINPDGKEHSISGVVDSENPDTLRVGFEDLRNLGDADYNDVVFDIQFATRTIEAPDTVFNDEIHGSALNDDITGGRGHDVIYAYAGNDTVYGDEGDDVIYGGEGSDLLRGGIGNDILHGETGKDVLVGNEGNDILYGGDSDDTLYGNDGNDTLYGGNHNDNLSGQDGDDFLYGEDGNDTLSGGVRNDFLSGGIGDDLLHGDDGDDVIYGGDGADKVYGGAGNDTVYGEAGADVLYGGDGHDTVFGGDGDDNIVGDAGDDVLHGGLGRDRLYGGDGNDILTFGEGADLLYGQAGADTFKAYETEFKFTEMAFVLDFSAADGDKIDITELLNQFNPDTDNIRDFVNIAQGANTTIQIDRDGQGGEFGWNNVLRLQGNTTLDTDVDTLLASGTLIV